MPFVSPWIRDRGPWFLVLILLLVSWGCSNSSSPSPKSRLVLRLTPGEVTRQEITMEQIMVHDSILTTNRTVFGITQEVDKVESDGTASIRITYDSIDISIKVGDLVVEYNSTSNEPPPPELLMQTAILGTQSQLTVDRRGRILAPQGPSQELPRKLILLFPEQAVTVGDTWIETVTQARGTEELTYTVVGQSDGVAEVSTRSRIQVDAQNMTGEIINLEGKGSGTYRIDTASGRLLSAEITQTIASTVQVGITNEVKYSIKTL